MPIMVVFDPPNLGRDPAVRSLELGPYRVAEIRGDVLDVFDGYQPLTLATSAADGAWAVNGLDGLVFPNVRFMPPWEQAEEELEALGTDDE